MAPGTYVVYVMIRTYSLFCCTFVLWSIYFVGIKINLIDKIKSFQAFLVSCLFLFWTGPDWTARNLRWSMLQVVGYMPRGPGGHGDGDTRYDMGTRDRADRRWRHGTAMRKQPRAMAMAWPRCSRVKKNLWAARIWRNTSSFYYSKKSSDWYACSYKNSRSSRWGAMAIKLQCPAATVRWSHVF